MTKDDQMQLTFFEPIASTMARAADDETSHIAARSMVKSGKAARQRMAVLTAVVCFPASTTAELAHRMSSPGNVVSRQVPGRRMIELERLGYVVRGDARRCEINGTKARTYFATDRGKRSMDGGGL